MAGDAGFYAQADADFDLVDESSIARNLIAVDSLLDESDFVRLRIRAVINKKRSPATLGPLHYSDSSNQLRRAPLNCKT